MKKPVFYSLVLILMLSPLLSAEENLFLPYDHKAYDQLAELARDGLLPARHWDYITKYQKSLTRYEIAFYLRNIIFRLEENPAEFTLTGQQEYIMKELVGEFDRELTSLGVDVTYLNRLFPVDFSTPPEQDDGYQDLDIILNSLTGLGTEKLSGKEEKKVVTPQYFVGQYYTGMPDWEYFLFIPETYGPDLPENDRRETWDIIYQAEEANAFLVVEGELSHGTEEIPGYYLFPLAEFANKEPVGLEKEVYSLLHNLSGSYWANVNSVQRWEGEWPPAQYDRLDHPYTRRAGLLDGIGTGIQIGDLILSTRLMKERTAIPPVLGEEYQEGTGLAVDPHFAAEKTSEEDLANHWQVDLQGSVLFRQNTLVYGGLRWEYEEQTGEELRQLSLVNSLINAGVSFKINDYLQMLVDYKKYHDFTGGENISQTSLGLGWGDHTLLTLRYRMLALEPAAISGEVSFKF